MSVWMTESTRPPKTATQKPLTANPLMIPARSQSRNPLMTKVKIPNVRRLIGSVRSVRIGLIVIFISPQKSARTSAVPKPLTEMPGTICGSARNARALTNHFNKIIGVSVTYYVSSITYYVFSYTIQDTSLPCEILPCRNPPERIISLGEPETKQRILFSAYSIHLKKTFSIVLSSTKLGTGSWQLVVPGFPPSRE